MKVCSQCVSHATDPCFFCPHPFSLSSPQALQPHSEKAGRSQGAGQRAELTVYSCQNTGRWVNLPCSMGIIGLTAKHLVAACHGL